MRRRKRRILEAATKLISNGGIEACTMRELARRARLDVTTLYNYYGSKEEILEALRRSGARKLERRIGELEETEPPLDRIRAIVDLMLGVRESPRALARPINQPGPRRRPGNGPIERVARVHLEAELRQAAADGDLIPSVDIEQLALVMLGHAHVWLPLWARRVVDAEETAARVGYFVSLCLQAAATDAARPRLEREMLKSQSRLAAIDAAAEPAAV